MIRFALVYITAMLLVGWVARDWSTPMFLLAIAVASTAAVLVLRRMTP